MLWLLAGAAVLFFLLGGMRAFERASVTTIKSLLSWVAALGGLSLAVLLVLTGREATAIWTLALMGPLIYEKWQEANGKKPKADGAGPRPRMRPRGSGMSRAEALEVLGLRPGASEAEIRDAHRRLMRAAHPDAGGSDWLATRINQARDVLLG